VATRIGISDMITPYQRTLATIAGRYDPCTDTGYYGLVESSDLITGDQLSEQLDFNAGISHNSDCGWFKFYIGPNASCNDTNHQKVIYVARMSLKHSISWNSINSANLITGNRTISIGDDLYRVRLLTGGVTKPGAGSEWNELLYRVHKNNSNGQSKWDTYDNAGIGINVVDGWVSWTQEMDVAVPTRCVMRGYGGLAGWYTDTSSHSDPNRGWRPVLEPAYPVLNNNSLEGDNKYVRQYNG
jgi:hypothetical protein